MAFEFPPTFPTMERRADNDTAAPDAPSEGTSSHFRLKTPSYTLILSILALPLRPGSPRRSYTDPKAQTHLGSPQKNVQEQKLKPAVMFA